MLSLAEHDFIEFMAERRSVSASTIQRAYLTARTEFKFASRGYKDLCRRAGRLFAPICGGFSEEDLILTYKLFAPMQVYRYLAYSSELPLKGTPNYSWNAQRFLELQPDASDVVDYGCGLAHLSYELVTLKPQIRIHLVDIESLILDLAKFRFKKIGVEVTVIPVTPDVVYPALPGHDICIAWEVMEHLERPLKAYKNILASLRSGGLLFGNFGDHRPRGLHVSPNLSDLRHVVSRDFESLGYNLYMRI